MNPQHDGFSLDSEITVRYVADTVKTIEQLEMKYPYLRNIGLNH